MWIIESYHLRITIQLQEIGEKVNFPLSEELLYTFNVGKLLDCPRKGGLMFFFFISATGRDKDLDPTLFDLAVCGLPLRQEEI